MADILIRGMKMPESCTHGYVGVSKTPSGEPLIRFDWCDERGVLEYTFIALPDGHGRLIEEKAALEAVRCGEAVPELVDVFSKILFDVPTIIPASE